MKPADGTTEGSVTCNDCGARNPLGQVHCTDCHCRLRTAWLVGDW